MADISVNTESLTMIISSVSAIGVFLYLPYKLGKYQEKIETISLAIDSLKKGQEKIMNILQNFGQRIGALEGVLGIGQRDNFIQAHSPLSLTKEGETLLKESGGKDFIDDHKEVFFSEITLSNPTTAYDVQDASLNIIINHSLAAIKLKKFAYNKPMELGTIFRVCSLYLRDCYLQAHPEIEE